MKGNPKVIAKLNEALKEELYGHQSILHSIRRCVRTGITTSSLASSRNNPLTRCVTPKL